MPTIIDGENLEHVKDFMNELFKLLGIDYFDLNQYYSNEDEKTREVYNLIKKYFSGL